MKSSRFTIVDEEGLQLDLEYSDAFFILHLPVFRATKGSFLHLKTKVEELSEFCKTIGYQAVYTAIHEDDKKMAKLMRMLGAVKEGNAQKMDVYKYKGVS